MAKPIFIIKLPRSIPTQTLIESMEKLTEKNGQLFEEYHVVPCVSNETELQFEVLNAVNATDVELEELKEKVMNNFKSIE